MTNAHFLMIPGPTPLPEEVKTALAQPPMGHRSPEFKAILKSVFPKLQWIFQTKQDVLLYTASGTGAMEAALVNTLNPGDKLLCLVCGVFSQRFADIAKTLGIDVEIIEVPAGEANTVEALKTRLDKDSNKQIKAVSMIYSETSTGVLNPVKDLVAAVKSHGALSIVDGVTGIASAEFKFDDWGVDVAVSGSQKGFMIPPGLSFLAASPKAWDAHKQVKNPGYYFNWTKTKAAQEQSNTPWTPSTALIVALDVALTMMQAEGYEAVVSRHKRHQKMVRAGAKALKLNFLVKDDNATSKALTSILPPDGVSVDDIRARLKNEHGIIIANGQKDLKGKIFRIGHLGYISDENVYTALNALEETLTHLGYTESDGSTAATAAKAVAKSQPCPV